MNSVEENSFEEPFASRGAAPSSGDGLTDNERLLAGFSYVSQIILPALLPVILLSSEDTKTSPFLRYHSVQSLGLLVATILYYMAAAIVYVAASTMIGCLTCVLWVMFLLPTVASVYFGFRAFRGRYVEIPWLTGFLRDNGWL